MKTLSTPLANEAAAEQSAWVELYDIYLKSAITTPWGTTSVIRLCSRLGASFSFFTPQMSPEDAGTQGDAATYQPWPLKRQQVRSSGQFADTKLEISASNVTAEFAALIAGIDWYDSPVVIRKTSPNLVGATAADCAILFSGLVDAVRMTDSVITLVCSNDLALLNRILPSENMHASCRFKWADDQCTMRRFLAAHYKSKTCAAASTTTLVKSTGLTEDTGNSASYGTDLINALADAAITASSEQANFSGPVFIYRAYVPKTGWLYWKYLTMSPGDLSLLVVDQRVRFPTTAPTGFTVGTWYYVLYVDAQVFELGTSLGGGVITVTDSSGSWSLEAEYAGEARHVRSGDPGSWTFGTDADWGTVENAYYVIPDAQAGLKNAALKPYIQFDLGSAKSPKLWRVSSVPNAQPEQRLRVIAFFSSPDASTWMFESYFEMPNRSGEDFDVLIPNATSARYWRICVRSRWAESLYRSMFYKVRAYELSRHWWKDGRVTFDAATATVALRNVSRAVVGSYDGEVSVAALPVAPASGDTFVIERGCDRTFNACCARLNTENYGGFNDLPTQTVIR